MSANEIESALKEIKDCQTNHNTTSCMFCKSVADCAKKNDFEQKTQDNLTQQLTALQSCQKSKGFSSCLNCAELLECSVRNGYVAAVYLSMNRGNGGSFEF
ncbi:MAG: hypothetical protein K2N75_02705 [Helicobacter sp.]|uniref:hypothetical protein n=1 Tax=Helicobacter sp. TaxID=218 RepID=UPI0023BED40A|nr:hypothetical protein [Helicobacter sp.]MDE5926814.1 hypothetical protein [Helicobacter sp.]MDE7174950.1 hypothetical protein [Helicobacter sp.]